MDRDFNLSHHLKQKSWAPHSVCASEPPLSMLVSFTFDMQQSCRLRRQVLQTWPRGLCSYCRVRPAFNHSTYHHLKSSSHTWQARLSSSSRSSRSWPSSAVSVPPSSAHSMLHPSLFSAPPIWTCVSLSNPNMISVVQTWQQRLDTSSQLRDSICLLCRISVQVLIVELSVLVEPPFVSSCHMAVGRPRRPSTSP